VVAAYYFGDAGLEQEWLVLFKNLYNHGVLSLRNFDGNLIPSVFMPPLYVFFIFFLKIISPENVELVKAVLIAQIILSTITIFIFYKLNNFFFSRNWSIFNSFLLSIFPLNIYSVTQISSASLQIFLIITYLYLFFSLTKVEKFTWLKIFYFSLISGLLILLRGEFYLIFIPSLIYLIIFKKVNVKKSIIILFITLLVISPYLIRNYFTFNQITLTKSVGFNLWKGNNPVAKVEGSDSYDARSYNNINEKIKQLPKNKLYDFNFDKLFLDEGLNYIINQPLIFIERYVKRFLSFFYFNIDSDYPNYYHPLFFIPIVFTSLLSSVGIFISLKDFNYKKGYLLLYLFLTLSIFSLFFILPRYKMAILPIQLIFMNYFFIECFKKNGFLNKLIKK
tara:strand:+ start:64 stop:1239 length:1176 start_codon:yes stop_codon:yes gene_type:complete